MGKPCAELCLTSNLAEPKLFLFAEKKILWVEHLLLEYVVTGSRIYAS